PDSDEVLRETPVTEPESKAAGDRRDACRGASAAKSKQGGHEGRGTKREAEHQHRSGSEAMVGQRRNQTVTAWEEWVDHGCQQRMEPSGRREHHKWRIDGPENQPSPSAGQLAGPPPTPSPNG